LWAGKSVKKGGVSVYKAQKSGEGKRKQKGGQRAGVYDGWQEGRGQEEHFRLPKVAF